MVTITLYVRQQKRQMYRTVFWTLWEMIWENGIETCIIPYKKRIASPGSMQDTGSLGLEHWDDPEEWYGEGGGYSQVPNLRSVLIIIRCWGPE